MTKHFAGFVLFSFIVGVGVFVSAITEPNVPLTVSHDYRQYKKKKKRKKRHHCEHRRRKMSAVILDEAEFNASTGLFSTNTSSVGYGMDGDLDLHFYSNDRFGPRFLKTERFANADADGAFSKELRWMKFLDSDQEVFVIGAHSNGWSDETIPPDFEPSKAVRVEVID